MNISNKFILILFIIGLFFASAGCQRNSNSRIVENEWQSDDQTEAMVKRYNADLKITDQIKEKIGEIPSLMVYQIKIQTYKGVVNITGFVNSKEASRKVVEIVKSINGVSSISNSLIVYSFGFKPN